MWHAVLAGEAVGTPIVFLLAGPVARQTLKFPDTWQLLINTGTSVVTFLVVFLISTRRIGIFARSGSS
jgi:low affinity Fe/Cu permease